MVSISRVCDQQQGTFDNQSVSIHSKLQERIENGSKLEKKRKDRESNRVCGKNEKDIRRDRSSIEESIRRNEEISR